MSGRSLLLLLPLAVLALSGCGSGSDRGSKLIAEVSDVLPKKSVEKQVRDLEADLSKKSQAFNKEAAWQALEDKLRKQKASILERKEYEQKALAEEAASYPAAKKRWAKWSSSQYGRGSLMEQLETMISLGDTKLEKACGGRFTHVKGHGHRLTLLTSDGIFISAASYRKPDNKPLKKLTGIELRLESGLDEKRTKMDRLAAFGLSAKDFTPISLSWAEKGSTFNWNGAKRRRKNDCDLTVSQAKYYSGKRWQALVFWSGP